ncbi:MAG: cadherin-like domain-containing protein [Phycisphaerae bacterium]|nr:cadherin-like domain-containing protein [Phycisphaerae bacterium]
MPKKRASLLTLLLIFSFSSIGLCVPVGMVHHWNFDEGPDWHDSAFGTHYDGLIANDGVGNANATLNNMDYKGWSSGRQFTGLTFDGIDDYLSLDENLADPLGATATVAFWVKTSQAGSSDNNNCPAIIAGDIIKWGSINANGQICLIINNQNIASSSVINDNYWHFIVINRNNNDGQVKIYVDGILETTATGPTGNFDAAIQSIAKNQNTYYQGKLDQIHIFNNVIDQNMVNQLMDNHGPKTWDTETAGVVNSTFSTESIFFKAYDPEQDALAVVSFTQPANGSASYNGDGTFNYTPDTDYVGTDTFSAIIEDGKGNFSTATINLQIIINPQANASNRTTTFIDFQAIQASGADISHSGFRVPRAIDWEGDGDNDLLISHGGYIWLYKNIGTGTNPDFAAGTRIQADGQNISSISSIAVFGDAIKNIAAVESGTNKIRMYLNTATAGQAASFNYVGNIKKSNGNDLALADIRFDIGDWNNDSKLDIIQGSRSGEVRVYENLGNDTFGDYQVIASGSYNLYYRLFDINLNGTLDLVQGINWGSTTYWFDPALHSDLGPSGTLTFINPDQTTTNVRAVTDGAIVDFADLNGDEVLDTIVGGHAGTGIYIAYGKATTVADSIAEMEAIYDAHPNDLGAALEANGQTLLNQIRAANSNIVVHLGAATLPERQEMFNLLSAHVQKYSFLQMAAPNTSGDTQVWNEDKQRVTVHSNDWYC